LPQLYAIGNSLQLISMKEPCNTVEGVLLESRLDYLEEKPVLQLVTPIWYDSTGLPAGADNLIVRAQEGHTAAVEALVRREITRAFPTLAVPYVQSVQDTMAEQLRPWRVGLLLFGGFGILALIIAALGTYSVLSYAVTQRLHELGVRIALGARADAVVRLVVGQGLRLALLGVVLGSVIALVASRVMQALLYDTSSREPTVTIAVGAMLLLIAAVASAVPARRASRVDPVTVLRAD
jgi:predicted lysophospholipase L1 biosynthesis ABC-type transport system permease subunit